MFALEFNVQVGERVMTDTCITGSGERTVDAARLRENLASQLASYNVYSMAVLTFVFVLIAVAIGLWSKPEMLTLLRARDGLSETLTQNKNATDSFVVFQQAGGLETVERYVEYLDDTQRGFLGDFTQNGLDISDAEMSPTISLPNKAIARLAHEFALSLGNYRTHVFRSVYRLRLANVYGAPLGAYWLLLKEALRSCPPESQLTSLHSLLLTLPSGSLPGALRAALQNLRLSAFSEFTQKSVPTQVLSSSTATSFSSDTTLASYLFALNAAIKYQPSDTQLALLERENDFLASKLVPLKDYEQVLRVLNNALEGVIESSSPATQVIPVSTSVMVILLCGPLVLASLLHFSTACLERIRSVFQNLQFDLSYDEWVIALSSGGPLLSLLPKRQATDDLLDRTENVFRNSVNVSVRYLLLLSPAAAAGIAAVLYWQYSQLSDWAYNNELLRWMCLFSSFLVGIEILLTACSYRAVLATHSDSKSKTLHAAEQASTDVANPQLR